jgi:hypothetical protein
MCLAVRRFLELAFGFPISKKCFQFAQLASLRLSESRQIFPILPNDRCPSKRQSFVFLGRLGMVPGGGRQILEFGLATGKTLENQKTIDFFTLPFASLVASLNSVVGSICGVFLATVARSKLTFRVRDWSGMHFALWKQDGRMHGSARTT